MLKFLVSLATQAFAAHATKQRLKRNFGQLAALLAMVLAVLLFAAIGLGFIIAALFLWLEQVAGTPMAALLVAVLMFVIAVLIALIARTQLTESKKTKEPQTEDLVNTIASDLVQTVEREPRSALLVALALGISVGFWRR